MLYALATAGQPGVEAWLRTLREELVRTMVLLGARSVEELAQTAWTGPNSKRTSASA